jgi:hypothetical protein
VQESHLPIAKRIYFFGELSDPGFSLREKVFFIVLSLEKLLKLQKIRSQLEEETDEWR